VWLFADKSSAAVSAEEMMRHDLGIDIDVVDFVVCLKLLTLCQ
jgi:hypothetical protein